MTQPHNAPTNRAEWSDLFEELDRWGESGRMATLWWRDDDVTAPNDRLDRLLAIAGEVPVTLAVIPAMVAPELVPWLARRAAHIAVVQHGWRHANHADGRRKSEFPAARAPAATRLPSPSTRSMRQFLVRQTSSSSTRRDAFTRARI